jgi:hypothetical protein
MKLTGTDTLNRLMPILDARLLKAGNASASWISCVCCVR